MYTRSQLYFSNDVTYQFFLFLIAFVYLMPLREIRSRDSAVQSNSSIRQKRHNMHGVSMLLLSRAWALKALRYMVWPGFKIAILLPELSKC